MTGWVVALTLYFLGFIGMRALAQDLQQKPLQTWRSYRNLLFWPVTVMIGGMGDICDRWRLR